MLSGAHITGRPMPPRHSRPLAARAQCWGCLRLVESPRPTVSPGRFRIGAKQLVALLALVILVAVGARLGAAPTGDGGTSTPPGVAVSVAPASRRDVVAGTKVTGVLAPESNLNLNCKVSGVVAKVYVALGDQVDKGQALLALSGSDLAPQVKAAEAALEAAQSQLARLRQGAGWEEMQQVQSALNQAQAGWEAAAQSFQRMKFLFDEGAISRQQYEASETQVKVAAAQLATAQMQMQRLQNGPDAETVRAAEAQVKQAEAGYDAACARLEDTILRAPVAGVVSYVRVSEGELIAPGVPQIGLVAAGKVYLEAAVTENLVPVLQQGAAVPVFVPAYAREFDGTVEQIAPAANAETRLFQVRIAVPNPDGLLKAGVTAEATIETARASGVLAVPREAVVTAGEARQVYVVAEGVARRRDVTTGVSSEALVEIVQGLTEGDKVVVAGVDFLRDGVQVNVVREVTP